MQQEFENSAKGFILLAVCVMFSMPPPASATLIDRGLFDDGVGGDVHLIYDDAQNITWLGDANFTVTWAQSAPGVTAVFSRNALIGYRLPNGDAILTGGFVPIGSMGWESAERWIDDLTVGGFADWRFPATPQNDPACSITMAICSEMGHLFHVDGISLSSPGPFSGLDISGAFYWGDRRVPPNDDLAFTFSFVNGFQAGGGVSNHVSQRVWAVRTGDVVAMDPPPVAVPEPSSLVLLGVGLLALSRARRRGFNRSRR